MELPFQLITDTPERSTLDGAFARAWPAYRRWIARAPEVPLDDCLAGLGSHMPELRPEFDRLHARFGGGDDVGRFLTLYNPPRVVRACTQLMLDTDDGPVLLRSYDHDPRLFDGVVLHADWGGVRTLALADCVWGALDGINEHGLAIALAFGGRNAVGDGFGAPLICRYILQTCSTVAEARAALSRLPCYMPYTFAVLDANGDFVTAYLGPDADTRFVTRRASTNHQGGIDWPEYARFVGSADRLALVQSLIRSSEPVERARREFLTAPIWRTNYRKASGTLYVAEYAPAKKTLDLHWPDQTEHIALDEPADRVFTAALPEHAAS